MANSATIKVPPEIATDFRPIVILAKVFEPIVISPKEINQNLLRNLIED
jgi:hypothetical protein